MSAPSRRRSSLVAIGALWAAIAAAIPAAASASHGSRMLLSLLAIPAATLLVLRMRGGDVCPRCRDDWGWAQQQEVTVEEDGAGGWRAMRRTLRSCSSCGASQLLQEPLTGEGDGRDRDQNRRR